MATIDLVFNMGEGLTEVGAIVLDALRSERNSFSSDITSYPVENGVDVSDHIAPQPEEVTLEGIITSADILVAREGRIRLVQAKELVRMMHENHAVITAFTGLDRYEDYGCSKIEINREAGSDKLVVTFNLKKIIKADVVVIKIPPEKVIPRISYMCDQNGNVVKSTSDNDLSKEGKTSILKKGTNKYGTTESGSGITDRGLISDMMSEIGF